MLQLYCINVLQFTLKGGNMRKAKKVYIIYQYNEYLKDFDYIAEYFNEKELQQKQLKNTSLRTIQRNLQTKIKDFENNLIDGKYLIIKNSYII